MTILPSQPVSHPSVFAPASLYITAFISHRLPHLASSRVRPSHLLSPPPCIHVHMCFSPSKSLLHYLCSPTPISGFVSQQSPIPVSPSLASASRKHETVSWPFIPPLSRLGFPLSLLSNLKTSNTSLPGLLPQPEVNTLQDGIISSTAL